MIMGHVSPSNPRKLIAMIVWLHVLILMTPGVSSLGNELFSCDFENDLCGLIQDTDDNFDWTRHQGSTASPNTGPSKAHSGTYYIYVEATQQSNQVASLGTPALGYQGQACVSVAYHMYGTSINQLQVSTSPDNDILWYVTGDQGDRWIERAEQVNLDYVDGIQLQGYIGYGHTGDIAVDDLVVTEGSCKEEVPLPYHCSFETGWCGMTQGYDDNFDWTRHDRSTPSINTGPGRASEGDWFIYIETSTSGTSYGYTALIETPAFNHTGSLCLRFHYHMYGYKMGTLTALHSTSGASSNAFQQTGNKEGTWFSAAVNVTGFQPGDWITFRASRGDSIFGDIAMDNINIAAGGCRDCRTHNGSCQHYCIPESTGDRCACYHGYRLAGETSCADIDECATEHECQQQCVNKAGSYTCACGERYVLATDNRHCIGYTDAYQVIVRASQGFTALCDTVALLPDVSLAVCLREAGNRNVSVVAHLNSLCDLKKCRREELNLAVIDGQKGWDVYALNNTWVERVMLEPDVTDDEAAATTPGGLTTSDSPGSSLWKILVGVVLGSAVILAFVVLVVVIIRRRRVTSPNHDPTVTYENDNLGIRSDVTLADDPNNPPEAGVYQEINTTGCVNMSDKKSGPTVEYQNDVVYTKHPYQDLGSNRQHLPDLYDTLNE